MNNGAVSIIIPTLNEGGNIKELTRRIHRALEGVDMAYEIIFIDDHSEDGTGVMAKKLSEIYPISFHLKTGKKGKAYSLLEGFSYAKYDLLAIIDADLQYPPEALPEMIRKIGQGCDIVVANRVMKTENIARRITHWGFNFFFSRLLHGLDCDVQSGMKVFRKKILDDIKISPSPWTFDLEFLIKACYYGYTLSSVNIFFAERLQGRSKIVFWQAIYEIGLNALKLRFRKIPPLAISSCGKYSMVGAGIAYKGRRFVTHTTLSAETSASRTLYAWQKSLILVMVILFLAGIAINPLSVGVFIISMLSIAYFLDAIFSFYLVMNSLRIPMEITSSTKQLSAVKDEDLPVYSVLCPLYKEAHMLPGFLGAISKLDWPKDRLDVLLLLEEDDIDTIRSANEMNLPEFVRILVIPNSLPKTKPKACNYGLAFAEGEYVVIYDAEDIPEPLQLKKAYLGFRRLPKDVWCLQAKLNYFNPRQNILTRLFTAEYSLWFDVFLPALQSINTAIPLGGTSNHFRRENLLELEGWDPFNVTEDCDLGMRIFKKGYKTAIIDSTTLEEANSNIKNWIRQRSRWIKGFIQTYFVHMRNPVTLVRNNGLHAFIFQLLVGGKTFFIFINPILWVATFSYFAFYPYVGVTIEKLYPSAVFYIAALSFVFGNFFYFYCYMIGCAKRGHWSIIKYVFLVPFYWLMTSYAALYAGYQLLTRPHYWEKTNHGLHLLKSGEAKKGKAGAGASTRIPVKLPQPLPVPVLSAKKIPERPQAFPMAALTAEKAKGVAEAAPASFFAGSILKKRAMLFSNEGVLIGAIMISNFFNFAFNIFLGRTLSFENLALVTLISSLWYIVAIFVGAFSSTVNHETAYLLGTKRKDLSYLFYSFMTRRGLFIFAIITVLWMASTPFLSAFFNIPDYSVLLIFAPAFTFGLLAYTNNGFLQGNLHFSLAAINPLSESVSKLVFAAILVFLGLSKWIYVAIPFSIIFSALASLYAVRTKIPQSKGKKKFVFPRKFFLSSLAAGISMMIFFSLDVILVKHFLSEREAGEYVLLSLVGKMIYFLGYLPSVFLIPLVSRNVGLKRSSQKVYSFVYVASFFLAALGVFVLGTMGEATVPIIFGAKASAILPYLNIYSSAILLLIISNVIVVYHLARKNYTFTYVSLLMAFGMVVGITLYHNSISDIVYVIFSSSALGWVLMEAMNYLEKRKKYFKSNLEDFLDIIRENSFGREVFTGGRKNILIFNWRDTKHKFAGGAEIYIQELAKKWVRQGNHVTIFCGNDGVCKKNEKVDGVKIIRRGGFYMVYVWAFIYYVFRLRDKYDVIVDCQNGIPFFTPLYATQPVYCLMHHVHQEVFRKFLSRPLSVLARFLEKGLMPVVYKKVPFITVSESSKKGIESLGLGKAGVWVVNPGVNLKKFKVRTKSDKPLILYLGRLKAYKSVDVLIKSFKELMKNNPDARLVIAGDGEEERNLRKLADEPPFKDGGVIFTGKISEREKVRFLQKAWVLVNPSLMEGWSIVVIEANACGTPVIASNVPGLRDSVKDGETGYLVKYGDQGELSKRLEEIIKDEILRQKMSANSRIWAEGFDWQRSSDDFLSVINNGYKSKFIAKKLIYDGESN